VIGLESSAEALRPDQVALDGLWCSSWAARGKACALWCVLRAICLWVYLCGERSSR
jgi:hypothetical protein